MELRQMNTGQHLPAYVFLEQFVENKRVLDVFPSDTRGAQFLATRATRVVTVARDPFQAKQLEESTILVTADPDHLPFKPGSFDVVFLDAQSDIARLPLIISFLKCARVLVGQDGMVSVLIPNRDAQVLDSHKDPDVPRYFDFERALRRHFPHVTMLAQKPLSGASFASIGRPDESAPLLDDRLIPEGSEVASHFLGVSASKYTRIDDSMIVKTPYEMLVEPIQQRIDRLSSNLSIAMAESDHRVSETKKLESAIADMKAEVEQAEILKHEKASAVAMLRDAERQLEIKDKIQAEISKTNEELSARLSEAEQRLFDVEQKARRESQKRAETENRTAIANKATLAAEQERDQVIRELRSETAEARKRQREVDDVREELAGTEVDLETVKAELDRQRKETLAARERVTKLEIELGNLGVRRDEAMSLEAELERLRSVNASERERVERRLVEEHARLLEEMKIRAELEKRALKLQKHKEAADAHEAEATERAELLADRLKRVTKRLETFEKSRMGARQAQDELEQILRDRDDKLERYEHQMDILNSRAVQSEQRASELAKQVKDLHVGLDATEANVKALSEFKAKALKEAEIRSTDQETLSAERQAMEQDKAVLEAEVLALREQLDAATSRDVEAEAARAFEERLVKEAEKSTRLAEELSGVKSMLAYEREQVRAEGKRAGEAELREANSGETIIDLEDELDQTRDIVARKEEDLTSLRNEVEDLTAHVHKLERELLDAEEERLKAGMVTEGLLMEKESELLKVSGDVEIELRLAAARYENAQGEIWQLKEEIVRLRAEAAAALASDVNTEKEAETKLTKTIQKQEYMITNLKRERDTIRSTYDRLTQAVKKKKKEQQAKDRGKKKDD